MVRYSNDIACTSDYGAVRTCPTGMYVLATTTTTTTATATLHFLTDRVSPLCGRWKMKSNLVCWSGFVGLGFDAMRCDAMQCDGVNRSWYRSRSCFALFVLFVGSTVPYRTVPYTLRLRYRIVSYLREYYTKYVLCVLLCARLALHVRHGTRTVRYNRNRNRNRNRHRC